MQLHPTSDSLAGWVKHDYRTYILS